MKYLLLWVLSFVSLYFIVYCGNQIQVYKYIMVQHLWTRKIFQNSDTITYHRDKVVFFVLLVIDRLAPVL